jgi:ATP synthase protein I
LTHAALPHSNRPTVPEGQSVTDPSERERLAQLDARIAKLKEKDAPKPHQDEHYSQAQLAWRMVIELVAGLGIGFGIGYGLDLLLGTLPIFLVVFTLLGLAAGIKTMMRSAAEIQKDMQTEGDDPGARKED